MSMPQIDSTNISDFGIVRWLIRTRRSCPLPSKQKHRFALPFTHNRLGNDEWRTCKTKGSYHTNNAQRFETMLTKLFTVRSARIYLLSTLLVSLYPSIHVSVCGVSDRFHQWTFVNGLDWPSSYQRKHKILLVTHLL